MKPPTDHRPEDNERELLPGLELGFIMHELKGPLAVIEAGARSMLAGKGAENGLSPRQERTLQRMLRSTLKSRELVAELLTIGQSELGTLRANPFKPATELRLTVLDCLEMLPGTRPQVSAEHLDDGAFEQAGVVLSIAPGAAELELSSSKSAFHHVCSNLIRNALRFKKSKVVVEATQRSEWLEIRVSDDGPGIPAAHRQSIFEPYAQAPGTAENSGHGLGLAMARTLARRLGGDVAVQDSEGEGSTFLVTMPLGHSIE